ncbi:hypothetical protein [Arthrobacter cupressi]
MSSLAGRITGHRPARTRRGWVHAVAALIFAAAAFAVGPGVVWGDTVQYIRIAHELQGASPDEAWETAYLEFCENPSLPYAGTVENCLTTTMAGHGPIIGYIDRNPQYQEIFSPRIGYPLLALPLMNLLGDRTGLWIIAVLSTAISGLLIVRLARVGGLSVLASTVAQAAFYLLPVSLPHGIALLAEAPTLLSSLVMAIGLAHVLKGARRRGVLLMTAGLALVFFFKYSSTMLLCVSFLALCLALLLFKEYRRRPPLRAAAVISALFAAASVLINSLLGLPGLQHSLQDTFTDHFRFPPVDDPLQRLLALEGEFAMSFLAALPANAGYLALFIAAVVGMVLAKRRGLLPLAGWAATGLSVYGVLSIVGHPVYSQSDRLGSSLWVGVAVGLGFLALLLQRRFQRAAGPTDPLPAGGRAPQE